jgi:hypothetical protein
MLVGMDQAFVPGKKRKEKKKKRKGSLAEVGWRDHVITM